MPVPRAHTDCDPGTWGATGGGGFITPTCQASTLFPLNAESCTGKTLPRMQIRPALVQIRS